MYEMPYKNTTGYTQLSRSRIAGNGISVPKGYYYDGYGQLKRIGSKDYSAPYNSNSPTSNTGGIGVPSRYTESDRISDYDRKRIAENNRLTVDRINSEVSENAKRNQIEYSSAKLLNGENPLGGAAYGEQALYYKKLLELWRRGDSLPINVIDAIKKYYGLGEYAGKATVGSAALTGFTRM